MCVCVHSEGADEGSWRGPTLSRDVAAADRVREALFAAALQTCVVCSMRSSVALQVPAGQAADPGHGGEAVSEKSGEPGEEAIGEGGDDYDSTKVQSRSSAN